MPQPLEFVIVEDDVVLLNDDHNYDVAEALSFEYPADGSLYRIESEQEPGHPFPGPVSAWNVGCNGDGMPFINLIQEFPLGDAFGSEDSNCANNAGSFDPNDKQGSPLGYGPDHLIEPGTDIEYLIRFQNTGTAPAHNVTIRDTLSPFLNLASLRAGAASHPYTWNFESGNVLVFRFDDINLVDSLSNEPASHGFISFKIAHRPEVSLGTVITNDAAIYFDFNEPIITNMTMHKLGEDFLEVLTADGEILEVLADQLVAFPNPSLDKVTAYLPDTSDEFQLFDRNGRRVQTQKVDGKKVLSINRNGLPSGIYLLRAVDRFGNELGSAKVVFY